MHGLLWHATTIPIMARMSSTHLVRNATRKPKERSGCRRRFGSGRLRDGLRAPAVFPSISGATVAYANWANAPTTDGSIQYDLNGNNVGGTQTISAGNRMTFDGTYYYLFDAAGNRTFKFKSTSVALDDTATDITKYTWDYRNRMTGLAHYADYADYTSSDSDMAIKYTYDAFNRQVDEDDAAGGLGQRTIWDGTSALETLNGSDGVTQRFLNGPAVDQVLAAEQVGGSYAGTNWLLADVQGTVRDVARATESDGSVTSVAAVDHVFYDVFGQQDAPQTAGSGQAATQVGFQGMLIDPLAGFHFVGGGSGGGGGYAPANSATGLYYSPVEGFYDSISQTHLTGAPGDASGAVNPYEVEGDAPTATAIVMADPPENSASPVGVTQSSGEGPDFAEYGSGVPVFCSAIVENDQDHDTYPTLGSAEKAAAQTVGETARKNPNSPEAYAVLGLKTTVKSFPVKTASPLVNWTVFIAQWIYTIVDFAANHPNVPPANPFPHDGPDGSWNHPID